VECHLFHYRGTLSTSRTVADCIVDESMHAPAQLQVTLQKDALLKHGQVAGDLDFEGMFESSVATPAKSPVSMHVQALTESLHTLHRLKAGQVPLTPQCKDMIAQLDTAAQMNSGNTQDSPVSGALLDCACY
jgi:aminoglycoside phosphotransferase